jgi:adenosine kinase
MKIAVTGSIAFDYLMSFPGYFRDHILPDKLDSISLSFLVDSMIRQRGGVGPNIAYTLALLGAHPVLIATAGEDFEEYRTWLESNGVDTCGVTVIKGEYTASFFANTDRANAQIASFYTGAMAHAREISIVKAAGEKPDLVIISPNDPGAMAQYVEECKRENIPYAYDPSQQIVRIDGGQLKAGVEGALALFVNEYEFELLQKATGLSADEIFGKVDVTVITCGEHGSQIHQHGKMIEIPVVPPKQIADPTGVGDAYRGGFLTGYNRGLSIELCGKMGALAATYCLEQRGTQNHHFTKLEFIQRFRENNDDQGELDKLTESLED